MDGFLEGILRQGFADGVFPAASACVAFREENRWWRRWTAACGLTRLDAAARPVRPDTFFDLASLTKPLCTALGFVYLVGEKGLDPDARVGELACCRAFPAHFRAIRIADLLSHSSGLPAYREFFRDFAPEQDSANRERLFRLVVSEPPEAAPGRCCLYSDLGYIVLGRILEELGSLPLDALFREKIAAPLGFERGIGFRPLGAFDLRPAAPAIAAAEDCPWRGRVVQGEVHDEHAWLQGGVAGHAGLFGTAEAVTGLCAALVDIRRGRLSHPHLRPEILRRFLDYHTPAGLWSLGFDRPTPGASSSGDLFSANTVGHLGFTGTSFWIDLDREIIVTLLTNRVHPHRDNTRIRRFRPWFYNRVMERVLEI